MTTAVDLDSSTDILQSLPCYLLASLPGVLAVRCGLCGCLRCSKRARGSRCGMSERARVRVGELCNVVCCGLAAAISWQVCKFVCGGAFAAALRARVGSCCNALRWLGKGCGNVMCVQCAG